MAAIRALRQAPGQRVLAPARPDEKDVHHCPAEKVRCCLARRTEKWTRFCVSTDAPGIGMECRTEKWTRFSVSTDAPARGMERRTEKWTRFCVSTDAPAMERRIDPKRGIHFSSEALMQGRGRVARQLLDQALEEMVGQIDAGHPPARVRQAQQ